MKVVLLSGYELGHQPLGLASPAAWLEAEGHAVTCFDLAVERWDPAKISDAGVVGISVPMHTAIRLGARWAARVRALNPTCHLVFYGLYASLNEEYLLSLGADSVIGGEFEQPLLDLIRGLAAGRPEPAASGVTTRQARARPFLGRQAFRLPARHLLPPLSRYARLEHAGTRRLAGAVEASRGCAHRCLHCPITPVYGGRLRIVPAETVLADIEQLRGLGAEHITFADPDFLNGIRHSVRIVEEMHRRHPEVTFDITTKIEHILEHRAVIPRLKDLGCLFIQSAVEGIADHVLVNLHKGHTRADVLAALEVCRMAAVTLRPTLVPFTPWTSLSDYLDLLDFIEATGLVDTVPPIQLGIRLLIPPGSSLLGTSQLDRYLGDFEPENFVWTWRHPDPRMDVLHATVSGLIEAATATGEASAITFWKIRTAALSALAGRPLPEARPLPVPTSGVQPAPPRLTEDWFC